MCFFMNLLWISISRCTFQIFNTLLTTSSEQLILKNNPQQMFLNFVTFIIFFTTFMQNCYNMKCNQINSQ